MEKMLFLVDWCDDVGRRIEADCGVTGKQRGDLHSAQVEF